MPCSGPYFNDYFNHPTRAQIGTMVAILEIGAFFSSLIVGRVGDIIGRRRTILYGSCIFFVGGAIQTWATSMWMIMLGRIIAGVGVGMLSTIVPVYQSEISPPHNRGKLACIEFSGNIIGYASSVWVDYFCGFIQSDLSWRIPLFMQCVMGGLLGLGSLIIVESPRCVQSLRLICCRAILLTFYPGGFSTTITTKKVSSSSPTYTAAATFTTPKHATSTGASRWTSFCSDKRASAAIRKCSVGTNTESLSPCRPKPSRS
jgi:MFS family permease